VFDMGRKGSKILKRQMKKKNRSKRHENLTYYLLTDRSPNFLNKLFRPFKFKGGKK